MSNENKLHVAGLVASTIDFVIKDAGLKMLLNGSIVIDQNFQTSFKNGRINCSGNLLAVAVISDLEEAETLKMASTSGLDDVDLLSPFIDMVVLEIIREFEKQSAIFKALP